MIPIECPKCGRGGSVPPDRLNARLVCKVCHTVFHLDNTGRMMLGEPGSSDPKKSKPRAEAKAKASMEDFDLMQTLKDIPKPVMYGVPGILVAVFAYMLYASGAPGEPDYTKAAEAIAQALISNNKSKVVSYSTSDSAEAAGKWFDLMHAETEKNKITTASPAQLMSGSPGDSSLELMVILTGGSTSASSLDLPMQRSGGSWLLDGKKGLERAEKAVAASAATAKKGG